MISTSCVYWMTRIRTSGPDTGYGSQLQPDSSRSTAAQAIHPHHFDIGKRRSC